MDLQSDSAWRMPDGHATGLLGLQPVLDRLSDPSHRCQGPELTCLLQALCKQLISAASDTNLAIFTSADRSRLASAQAAAAEAAADLSIGAPEQCTASPQPFSSAIASTCNVQTTHPEVEAPASSQVMPASAVSTNTTPLASAPVHHTAAPRGGASRSEAEPQSRPTAAAGKLTATAPAAPSATNAGAGPAALSGLSPAAMEPTQGLAGMVASGIALLVDHLEHFHYRAKAVALDGLLSLSAVGLGPDRRLDPVGVASVPLPATGSGGPSACSTAAAAAAVAAAAALAAGADGQKQQQQQRTGEEEEVADAVQALGGLGLGDWLALRIVGAGAVPRVLEMLTQRTGINFVPMRQLASQVMHNLARRRNPAVRTALARWRPLPGVISALDVVLEDSPEIAAKLLLSLSDLFPISSHQIAGVLHKLIAKQQQQQQEEQAAAVAATAGNQQSQAQGSQQPQGQGNQGQDHAGSQDQQQQPPQAQEDQPGPQAAGGGKDARDGPGAQKAVRGAAEQKASAAAVAADQAPPAAAARARRVAKLAAAAAEPSAAGRGAAAAAAAAAPNAAASRPRRGAAAAAAPAPAKPPAPAPVVPAQPQQPPPAAENVTAAATTYPGLAPDVDVPLEALLMRVTGYYMRLAYNAVLTPAPLPPAPVLKPPFGDMERREYEKAVLTQKLDEHRRRRKEAGQLDCCVAALLAAAPMPTCLFDALSYSHARAFAMLTGPALTAGLAPTSNGGLWRSQDLLPYALTLIQSLGGGSDTGDGGSAGTATRAVAPTATAAMLMSTAVGGGNAAGAGRPLYGNTVAVSAALDRFWALEPHRAALGSGSACGGGTGSGGASLVAGCAGPALPGAPYGDKPVTTGLMDQCSAVIRGVLERAVLAADMLPGAAAAASAAAAAAAASGNGSASSSVLAELPLLSVLRSVGTTMLYLTRAQTAERVVVATEVLKRLTSSLAQSTGSPSAGVAQARMVLGLANVWACVHEATAAAAGQAGRKSSAPLQASHRSDRSRSATPDDSSKEEGPAQHNEGAVAPGKAAAAVVDGKDGGQEQEPVEDKTTQLRRSARIKRRRDGAAAAGVAGAAPAAVKGAAAAASGGSALEDTRSRSVSPPAGNPDSRDGPDVTAAAAAAEATLALKRRNDGFLSDLVDVLAARFTEVRKLQAILQRQQTPQRRDLSNLTTGEDPSAASVATSGLSLSAVTGILPAAGSALAGPWLAAAAAAVVGASPADKSRLVVETQAVLLQAVALLLPGMSSEQARRLVEVGAGDCSAGLVQAASKAAGAQPQQVPSAAPAVGSTDAAAALGDCVTTGGRAADPGPLGQEEGAAAAASWNEEPLYGVTAVQALGVLVELLELSGDGAADGGVIMYGRGEVLAALGGLLLLQPWQRQQSTGAAGGGGVGGTAGTGTAVAAVPYPLATLGGPQQLLPAPLSGAPAVEGGAGTESLVDPSSRCWDLVNMMVSGRSPCAHPTSVLQLLVALATLTHGSSTRCAAARTALTTVLLQVTRWNHSDAQRRRLFAQVVALWRTHLQPLLLRLPRLVSPSANMPDAPCAIVTAAATDAAPLYALPPVGANKPYPVAARTNSQSTMPYHPSRGSSGAAGRFSTPTTHAPSGVHASGGGIAAQRTPPWGASGGSSCAGGGAATVHAGGSAVGSAITAAAAAALMLSPTRHTGSFTGPSGGGGAVAGLHTAPPPVVNPLRARRGSRLGAAGLTSPLPAPRGVVLLAGGDVGATGAAGVGEAAAASSFVLEGSGCGQDAAALGALCELLEAVTGRLADGELVRHLHSTGWLRALSHGAHCTDLAVRDSCQRTLSHAARALAAATTGCKAASSTLLHAADLDTDAELRNLLGPFDTATKSMANGIVAAATTTAAAAATHQPLAALRVRAQESSLMLQLPPRVPAGDGTAPRAASVTSRGAVPSRAMPTCLLAASVPPLAAHASGWQPLHEQQRPPASPDRAVGGDVAVEKDQRVHRVQDAAALALSFKAPGVAFSLGQEAEPDAPQPQAEQPAAPPTLRVTRSRKGTTAAAGRGRKGARATSGRGKATAGAAAATAAAAGKLVSAPSAAAAEPEPPVAVTEVATAEAGATSGAAAASGRTRSRKAVVTRRVRTVAAGAGEPGLQEPQLQPQGHAEETVGVAAALLGPEAAAVEAPVVVPRKLRGSGGGGAGAAGRLTVVVEGEGSEGSVDVDRNAAVPPLISPVPKRRRLTEDGEEEGCPRADEEEDEEPFGASGRRVPSAKRLSPSAFAIAADGADPALAASASLASASAAGASAPAAALIIPAMEAATAALYGNDILDLQLTADEARLAAAVRTACVSLESALAARRHDLAAVRAADQAAAAAAAAAATMAIAASVPVPSAPTAAPVGAEESAAASGLPPGGAKKKVGRGRAGVGAGQTVGAKAAAGKQQLPAPTAAAARPPLAQQPQPPAVAATMPAQPVAVCDEEFLSRTYRGVSKRLNFDDM